MMMPSRGLQLSRGRAPRVFQQQCRNLSSTPRVASRIPSRIRLSHQSLQSRQWQTASALGIPAIVAARHASTTTTSPSTAAAPTSPGTTPSPPTEAAPEAAASFPNLDTITIDDVGLETLSSVPPDTIGYLHSLGLNYGWGPTSMLEWLLEHIHVFSGMPWWGSIATTALVVRIVAFPLFLRASDQNAKAAALTSVTAPLVEKMKEAQKNGDSAESMKYMQQQWAVRARAGITLKGQFAPMVVQSIVGFCGFRLVRAMAELPVPELKTGGLAWLSDLTVSDPYGLTPILMAASVHALIRLGGESGTANLDQSAPAIKAFSLYGMPGIILLIMLWQPGALCVWFAASGAMGIGQALLLQRPAVRKFFGIAPTYKPGQGEAKAEEPMRGIINSAWERASGRSAAAAELPQKASFTAPQWQAPNIRTRGTTTQLGKVIDVKATQRPATSTTATPGSADDMISAAAPPAKKGFASGITDAVGNIQKLGKSFLTKAHESEAAKAKRRKDAMKKAADDYERRASMRQKYKGR